MKLTRLLLLLLVWLGGGSAWAQTEGVPVRAPEAGQFNPAAETWIKEMVGRGEVADLEKKFGKDEKPRRIRATFLQKLLTDNLPGVKLHFHGIQIRKAVIIGSLDLEHAEIPHRVRLADCGFLDDLKLANSHFKKSLELDGSHFKGEAVFDSANIEKHLLLDRCRFEKFANFFCVKVGQNLFIRSVKEEDALFKGMTSFNLADIGGALVAEGTKFQFKGEKEKEEINFSGMKVGTVASFKDAEFEGPVNFRAAQIGWQFIGTNAKFKSKKPAIFNSIKVGTIAGFDNAEFHGLLDFVAADIGQYLSAKKTKFHQLAQFEAIKVPIAHFWDAEFKEEVNLKKAVIRDLSLGGVRWPLGGELRVQLDGLTYGEIIVTAAPKSKQPAAYRTYHTPLKLVNNSSPNSQNYAQLEAFYKRGGKEDTAEEVFIQGKRREWWPKKWWGWLSPTNWATLIFWDGLAGYGRKPERTFLASLLVVLLGAFIFNPDYLDKKNWLAQWGPRHPWVVRFFLSLDRFLPAVDLGLADLWEAKEINFLTWIYWQVEMLCGWVLIPIALAAIYTNIK
ncbi:MAG: hypothetical protein AB1491_09865 [Thermodesulfobacteriota bacterium]